MYLHKPNLAIVSFLVLINTNDIIELIIKGQLIYSCSLIIFQMSSQRGVRSAYGPVHYWSGIVSQGFHVTNGVRQGGILSPFLLG